MPKFVVSSGLYGWDASKEQISTVRKRCALFAAVSLVISIVCGVLPTGVSRHNWVGFAGTAALIAVMLMVIVLVRFCLAKEQLDYRSFHTIHWMMDYAPLLHALLMAVALIAGIVSCIQSYSGALDILALILFAAAACSSLLFRKTYKSLSVYEMKEHDS